MLDAVCFHKVDISSKPRHQIMSVSVHLLLTYAEENLHKILPLAIYDEFSIVEILKAARIDPKEIRHRQYYNFWNLLWNRICINLCQHIRMFKTLPNYFRQKKLFKIKINKKCSLVINEREQSYKSKCAIYWT